MPVKPEISNLRSEEVRDILKDIPGWILRWGNLLIVLIIIVLVLCTWVIKYPEIILADAVLTTNRPPLKKYAKISGKIDSIHVKDSDLVSENSILAVLENTANSNDVFYLKSVLDTMDITKNKVDFPVESIPILLVGEIEDSYAEFENNYIEYLLNIRRRPYDRKNLANRISLGEIQRKLYSINSQIVLSKDELLLKNRELERNKALFKKGVISQQELENKHLETIAIKNKLKQLEITKYQTNLEINNSNYNSLDNDINRELIDIQLYKKTIQALNKLKKAILDWEEKYVIRSEIAGRVSFINYWDKNQYISQDELIFVVLPYDSNSYVARLRVNPNNSGKINIGQSVNLNLDNFPKSEYGVLQGYVNTITEIRDEEGYYIVNVSLPEVLKTSYNKEIRFKQEMSAKAEIITNDLRIYDRILISFYDAIDR